MQTVTAYKLDRERYKLTPMLSNGQYGTPIELYPLFEASSESWPWPRHGEAIPY